MCRAAPFISIRRAWDGRGGVRSGRAESSAVPTCGRSARPGEQAQLADGASAFAFENEGFFTADGREVWAVVRGENYISVIDPVTPGRSRNIEIRRQHG